MEKVVSLNRLTEKIYRQVICYPRFRKVEMKRRILEMEKLHLKALSFEGTTKIANIPVLGKGCVGIVVSAYIGNIKVALKIRRTDADRPEMKHEAEMLRLANSVYVGPKLIEQSTNFLVMELVEGLLFPQWLESLIDSEKANYRVHNVVREMLEQTWRLDKAGLDHGELSHASKHIVVDRRERVYLVDFETASVKRKVHNVTSIIQYLFMQGAVARLVDLKMGKRKEKTSLQILQRYNKSKTREEFESVLKSLQLI